MAQARQPEDVLTLLRCVEAWAEATPSVDPAIQREIIRLLHQVSLESDNEQLIQRGIPRPIRNPTDEGPRELLEQVRLLLRAGVGQQQAPAIQRMVRAIMRTVRQLHPVPHRRPHREPALRAGALMGAHRPTADQPTARERLRQDADHDPWDSD